MASVTRVCAQLSVTRVCAQQSVTRVCVAQGYGVIEATATPPLPRGSVPKDGMDEWKQDGQKGLDGRQQRQGGEERGGGGGAESKPQSWEERIRTAMEGAREEDEGAAAAAGDSKVPCCQ
jgi:hypothetical protein